MRFLALTLAVWSWINYFEAFFIFLVSSVYSWAESYFVLQVCTTPIVFGGCGEDRALDAALAKWYYVLKYS